MHLGNFHSSPSKMEMWGLLEDLLDTVESSLNPQTMPVYPLNGDVVLLCPLHMTVASVLVRAVLKLEL